MKIYLFAKSGLYYIALIFIISSAGCGGQSQSDYSKAVSICTEKAGTVVTETESSGNTVNYCEYTETITGDDGQQKLSMKCELMSLLNGTCSDGPGTDISEPVSENICLTCPETVREMFRDQVEDILLKLDNTGYSHRPFSLDPDYSALTSETHDSYNLFLDCSGFVGFYVIQGVSPVLYNKVPRRYSCGPITTEDGVTTSVARPLAADFYDLFKAADSYNDMDEATSITNACWSRIDSVKDARPGDVIVYLHPDNLDMEQMYCCAKNNSKYEETAVDNESECTDGRITYKAKKNSDGSYKNTGHVLFVHGIPCRSTEKKGTDGEYQWVVEIADSTTSPHMSDSRAKGTNASGYDSNSYTAWTKSKGYLYKCSDGSYKRTCPDSDTGAVKIEINTAGTNATGIGIGKMYVNNDMTGYRTNYSNATQDAKVMIGRPVVCPD